MRKKLLKAVEKGFVKQVQEKLPGFAPCGEMGPWNPALRFSDRNNLHFFLALSPRDGRDCFNVICGVSESAEFPIYVGTLSPSDPPEYGALAFPVGTLWEKNSVSSPQWCFTKEPDLHDPIEKWMRPAPSQEELLEKVPQIVEKCIDDLKGPVIEFIRSRGGIFPREG